MMNPNDVMAVVLKDILYLLGFRFIYKFILVVIICKTFQMCYFYQHACLLVCLFLLSACLSVKLLWMIQVTREMQGNS